MSFRRPSIAVASGAALLTFDTLQLQHDPQRCRYFGYVLLAISGTFKRPGKLAPSEFGAVRDASCWAMIMR